ncbi:MAG: DUF4920 domain-containing protein [Planctomycetia bacterium]|nr:DUF4920 domain-containing protein [Planctomycetia bacterium]
MHHPFKRLTSILATIPLSLVLWGCGGSHATNQALGDGWNAYGDAQTVKRTSVPVASLPEAEGYEIVLEGWVTEVCAVKGCWMRVQDDDGDVVLVRFKDYGFFVPRNARGRRTVIHGTPLVQTFSVAQRRHLLEDAKASAEEIARVDEPSTEVVFLADGAWVQGGGLEPPYAPATEEDCIIEETTTEDATDAG